MLRTESGDPAESGHAKNVRPLCVADMRKKYAHRKHIGNSRLHWMKVTFGWKVAGMTNPRPAWCTGRGFEGVRYAASVSPERLTTAEPPAAASAWRSA